MSKWTHVNGNIRFDYLPIAEDKGFVEEIENVLGKIQTYDQVGLFGEDHKNCPSSHIPCGSEGSIEYHIHKTPRGYDVSVWGDLRDFSEHDVPQIISWFGGIMKHEFKPPFFIRDAILEVRVEYGNTYILRDWHDDKPERYRVDELMPEPV